MAILNKRPAARFRCFRPLMVMLVLCSTGNLRGQAPPQVSPVDSGYWMPVAGVEQAVDIMEVHNGHLYVGGLFVDAGGNPDCDGVVRWTGSGWEALGPGLRLSNGSEPWITSLLSHNGYLYVGGSFHDAGGDPDLDFLAKWDGQTWSGVAPGINNKVYSLYAEGNNLYVGGNFRNAAGNGRNDHFTMWNDSAWIPFANGLNNTVFAINRYQGELLVGGSFVNAGGDTLADFLARWNGSDWEPFGNGLNHWVQHIGISPAGELYIAGLFTDAGGDPRADHIAKWNGIGWEGLGGGLDREVEEFIFDDSGGLIAVGFFQNVAGDTNSHFIGRWNGTSWEKYGAGFNGETRAIRMLGDSLFVGGTFSIAGGQVSHNVSCWVSLPTAISEAPVPIAEHFSLAQNYPNPFNPATHIRYTLPAGGRTSLVIYNVLGQAVRTLAKDDLSPGTYEQTWEGYDDIGRQVAAGVYLCRLSVTSRHDGKTRAQTRKMLLIR